MAKQQCQTCKEWFKDSELDDHLNEHIGVKGNPGFEDLPKRRPGRRGEFLGGASGLLGFVTAFVELLLFGRPRCSYELGCLGVPLSIELFLVFTLSGSVLGLIGASTVGRHWRAGSSALLVGGVLALTSWAGLALTSNIDYGPPISFISFFISFSFSFLLFVGWAPLLILAGALALSDSPRKRANRGNEAGFLKETTGRLKRTET